MFRTALQLYFATNVVLLVLLSFSFPFLERGTATFVVAMLALGIILVGLLVSGGLIYTGALEPDQGSEGVPGPNGEG